MARPSTASATIPCCCAAPKARPWWCWPPCSSIPPPPWRCAWTARASARRGAARAWRYALAHPQEMVDLVRARYPERRAREELLWEAQQVLPLLEQNLIELGYSNPQRWQAIADQYAAAGMLPKGTRADAMLYHDS